MSRRVLLALIGSWPLLAVGAQPGRGVDDEAAAPKPPLFGARTLAVPLDRSGTVPGTVRLAVAVERPRKGADGFLLALSGGPGQPSVAFADSFRASLAPALAHRRLVLLDQRGTGASGALRCPPLQALGALDVVNTRIVEACASALGPGAPVLLDDGHGGRHRGRAPGDRRAEARADGRQLRHLRRGAVRPAVPGEHRRADPRLGRRRPTGSTPTSWTPSSGCRACWPSSARRRAAASATQRPGRRPRHAGAPARAARRCAARSRTCAARRTTTAIHDESELLLIIMSGDLNPFLQAALPGAIAAAARGDAAPLLRLRAHRPGAAVAGQRAQRGAQRRHDAARTCAALHVADAVSRPLDAWRHGADGGARQRVRAVQPRGA